MQVYDENYLLNKSVKIYQPHEGYRASTDAVWLAAALGKVKKGDTILDVEFWMWVAAPARWRFVWHGDLTIAPFGLPESKNSLFWRRQLP